jgi:hypothetical protein
LPTRAAEASLQTEAFATSTIVQMKVAIESQLLAEVRVRSVAQLAIWVRALNPSLLRMSGWWKSGRKVNFSVEFSLSMYSQRVH